MSLRNWLKMFGSTLLVGALTSIVARMILGMMDPELQVFDIYVIIATVGAGMLYSVLSQMGFFAYMTLNYIAQSMFKKRETWLVIQWIAIVFVFVDCIVIRAYFFEGLSAWYKYTPLPLILIAVSAAAAYWRGKMTNFNAFIPTLFFLFVVTAVESVPALRQNDVFSIIDMMIPLFACNAWQILRLPRYLKSTKS